MDVSPAFLFPTIEAASTFRGLQLQRGWAENVIQHGGLVLLFNLTAEALPNVQRVATGTLQGIEIDTKTLHEQLTKVSA